MRYDIYSMDYFDRERAIKKIKDYKRSSKYIDYFLTSSAIIAMRKRAIIGFMRLDGIGNAQYWDYIWYGIWSTQWNKFLHLIRTYRKDLVGKRLPLYKEDQVAYFSFFSFLDYLKKLKIRVCTVRTVIQTLNYRNYVITVIGDCNKDYSHEEWETGKFPKNRIYKMVTNEVDLQEMIREVPLIYGNKGYI